MNRALIAMALCAALPAAYAEDNKGNYEAKKQEYFARAKELKLEAVRGRIGVMQDAAWCIQSAGGPEAMRSCEERERAGMESHMKRMKERWESMKPR